MFKRNTSKVDIIEMTIGTAALFEQLAEECTELAKASLKVARKLRGENPTPISMEDAVENVNEEFSDILLVADVIGLFGEDERIEKKRLRWIERIGADADGIAEELLRARSQE